VFKPKEAVAQTFENEDYYREFLMGKKNNFKLPRGFEEFVNSDFSAEMVDSIFDYCVCLIRH
jgi:hypothetical protein